MVTTHELAESVTDPQLNATYYDASGNEVGDVVNGSTVYLNGYAVQARVGPCRLAGRLSGPDPAGGDGRPFLVAFSLSSSGVLTKRRKPAAVR